MQSALLAQILSILAYLSKPDSLPQFVHLLRRQADATIHCGLRATARYAAVPPTPTTDTARAHSWVW